MISRLIAWGCSFTWGEGLDTVRPGFGQRASDRAWPALVAQQLNIPLRNLSEPGASNLWIADSVLNYEFKPEDLVIIMWTWPTRTTRGLARKPRHILPTSDNRLFESWVTLYTEDDILRQDRIIRTATELYLTKLGIDHLVLDVLTAESSWADLPLALDQQHPGLEWHERISTQILAKLGQG